MWNNSAKTPLFKRLSAITDVFLKKHDNEDALRALFRSAVELRPMRQTAKIALAHFTYCLSPRARARGLETGPDPPPEIGNHRGAYLRGRAGSWKLIRRLGLRPADGALSRPDVAEGALSGAAIAQGGLKAPVRARRGGRGG